MGFFKQQQQTKIITIDNENTITIRKLTFGEAQEVLSVATAFDVVAQDAQFDFAKSQLGKLERAIVSWDGPGFEGQPVTPANLRALPPEIGRVLVKAVEEFNQGLTEQEQKN
jgi:hypothetical protein